jgi:hypothetical protein
MIIDAGVDFPDQFRTQLVSMGREMTWFRPRQAPTTRALNMYSGQTIGYGFNALYIVEMFTDRKGRSSVFQIPLAWITTSSSRSSSSSFTFRRGPASMGTYRLQYLPSDCNRVREEVFEAW